MVCEGVWHGCGLFIVNCFFFFLDEKELLGELQVSFVCFLVGHGMCVYPCGKGWESFKLLVTRVVKGGHSIAPLVGDVCVYTHVVKGGRASSYW